MTGKFQIYKSSNRELSILDSGSASNLNISGISNFFINPNINLVSDDTKYILVDSTHNQINLRNNKFSIYMPSSGNDTGIYIFQRISGQNINLKLGNRYLSGNSVVQDYFNLNYGLGELNLDIRPKVNKIPVLLSGEGVSISNPSGYLTGINFSDNYDGGYFIDRNNLFKNKNSIFTKKIFDNLSFKTISGIEPNANIARFKSIATSSEGKYLTVVAGNVDASKTGNIFISSDFGLNWTNVTGAGTKTWFDICMSNDGKYQTAIAFNDKIYTSKNYGISWSPKMNDQNRLWTALGMNADGKYQIATVYNSNTNGVYLSNDYGENWNLASGINTSLLLWRGAAINGNGKYQSLVSFGDPFSLPSRSGLIFISDDYGNSWTQKNLNSDITNSRFMSIGVSNLGKTQIACTRADYPGVTLSSKQKKSIFISNNYGQDWISTGPTGENLENVEAICDEGKVLTAVSYFGSEVDPGDSSNKKMGKIYISNNYGYDWTGLDIGKNKNWTSIAGTPDGKYFYLTAYGESGIYISKTPEFIDGDLYTQKIYSSGIYAPNIPDTLLASTGVRRYVPDSTVSFGTSIPPTGFANYFPFILKKDAINPNICIETTTNVQENNIRIGIYSGAGFEGAKLFFSGTITVPNLLTGIHKIQPNITLPKGAYTFATLYTGTSATTTTYRNASANGYMSYFGFPTGITTFNAGASSTQSDLVAFETGLIDLNPIIGTGSWSRTSKAPVVCLEY